MSQLSHAQLIIKIIATVFENSGELITGEALQELSGKFTNKTMQQLNYQVDGEHHPVSQVAADFLKEMYGKR